MNWSKIFARLSTDGHMPVGIFVFIVGTVVHWIHGLDASYVSFTTTVLGFLGVHSFVQGKYPDAGGDDANNK